MSEQLQVVAFLTKPDFCEPYVGLHRDSMTTGTSEPLMTVAQHEHIVAAKDAEIARLDAGWHEANKRVLEVSLAQPARQVGGGIKEAVTMDGKTTIREYVAGAVPEDTPMDEWTKGYEECKRRINRMLMQPCNQGAALAPAAVAVVIPEPCAYRWSWKECRDDDGWGYRDYPTKKGSRHLVNEQALINRDELIRLNRRAIPAGLILRALQVPIGPKEFADREAAQNELRALLGKEGE